MTAMATLAIAQAINELSIMPPSFDLSKVLASAKRIRTLDRDIARAEAETLAWRARTIGHLRQARGRLYEIEESTSREIVAAALLPQMGRLKDAMTRAEESVAIPFDKLPEIALLYTQIQSTSPDAARHMRKQFKRVEIIRQNLIDAYETFRDMLLAVEWDYDPDARGGPSFDNAQDLLAYLHT
jgi:hypothetical protein